MSEEGTSVPEKPWRLLSLAPVDASVVAGLVGDIAVSITTLPERTQAAVLATAAATAPELILGDWNHQLRVGSEEMDAAPTLAFIQQPAAGVETMDLTAAAARGIPVCNTGSANSVAVAEWCLMTTLALMRGLLPGHLSLSAGEWPQMRLPSRELTGAPIGILGMGRIGIATATRLSGLGAEVSYFSRTPKPELSWPHRELDELLGGSDVIICLLPSSPQTRMLLNGGRLAQMRPGAFLVSAGRGDLLDENALAAALHSGAIAAAALDVYTVEPLPAESVLRSAPNVLFSPHRAGATDQARRAIMAASRANLLAATTGAQLREVVNGVDPVVRRRPTA